MEIFHNFCFYSSDHLKGSLVRLISPIVAAFIVLLIPSFSAIMGLIGATCCSLLAFILPGLFHLKLFKGTLKKSSVIFDYFLIALGTVGAILGTHDALVRIGLATSDREVIDI